MKIFLLSILLLGGALSLSATEYFSGSGHGAQIAGSGERDFTTGWINDLIAEINASPNLTAAHRNDALQVVYELTGIAALPGTFGVFNHTAGAAFGTIMIFHDFEYIVGPWHIPGSAYSVVLWLEAPTAIANTAPNIAWISAPASADHGQGFYVAARGHDPDGNLTQVQVWKNGQPFASAGGGDGTQGDAGNWSGDPGPQSITFTAQAFDAVGAASAIISHTITIGAPPPAFFQLTTLAGTGGSVSPGGMIAAGTTTMVTAVPESAYDFAGWSGGAIGMANPIGVLMDGHRTVQANFVLKQFSLVTGASGGGSVTPGGTYPYGTVITLTASPDAVSRFIGWAGDAGGSDLVTAILMVGPRSVHALFEPKSAQTIIFPHPGDQPSGSPPFPLDATSSAGLPVVFAVLDGPAVLVGNQLQITGPGLVTVQASQPGDGFYLAAAPVTQSFNSVAPVVLQYHGDGRTLLQGHATGSSTHHLIETP